jgi:hypothetical protein
MKKPSQLTRRKMLLRAETIALLKTHELRPVVGGNFVSKLDPRCDIVGDPEG